MESAQQKLETVMSCEQSLGREETAVKGTERNIALRTKGTVNCGGNKKYITKIRCARSNM